MNILFVLCEGQHDAQAIGRLLEDSEQFKSFQKPLKNYPVPLDKFIALKFQNQEIDEIRIGKHSFPLVPICAFHNPTDDLLVLPIPLGGKDQANIGNQLLQDIELSLRPGVLEHESSPIEHYAVLFIYDADNRGTAATCAEFKTQYTEECSGQPVVHASKWFRASRSQCPMAVYVFSGEHDQGTLEDLLETSFNSNSPKLLQDAKDLMTEHFQPKSDSEDSVAYEAKQKKGLLTVCGQAEKKLAGAALTVVLRDTSLLKNAFALTDPASPWKQLLDLINQVKSQW